MVIKSMLVDDEQNARSNLRLMLENYCDDIEICWELDSAEKALKVILKEKPDLMFIDIEMSGLNGLELAQCIAERNIPIIFVTAYDQYALAALKVGAIDYLLKPFKISELQNAIHQVKKRIAEKKEKPYPTEVIKTILRDMGRTSNRLLLPWHGGFKVFDCDKIIYLKSDNSYSTLFLEDQSQFVVTKSIGELETALGKETFFRIHNTSLINLKFVSSFSTHNGGVITMINNIELPVARRRIQKFKKQFEAFNEFN